MDMFFAEDGDFDHIFEGEYQISYAQWKEDVKTILPQGAKHLVVNSGDCTVSFWSDDRNLKTVKVVGITLEDGTVLTI